MSNEAMRLALEALKESHPEAYRNVIKALEEALAKQEQGESVAWRETYGKVIKALAGIVNVHTPDNLFDLDAIPRDSVMVLVQNIKVAIDQYKPPKQEQGAPDSLREFKKDMLRREAADTTPPQQEQGEPVSADDFFKMIADKNPNPFPAYKRKPIDLASAIEYADARWSGVDVPVEWLRHFVDGLLKEKNTTP